MPGLSSPASGGGLGLLPAPLGESFGGGGGAMNAIASRLRTALAEGVLS